MSKPKRGDLTRWLRSPGNWQELKMALRDPSCDADQTVRRVRREVRAKFGKDSDVANSLDDWLGFLARMPETTVGANPFYFARSSQGREIPIHPEDPTHVVTNVELTRRLFQFCFPEEFRATEMVEKSVTWMELLDFRPLSRQNAFLSRSTVSCPLLASSVRYYIRQSLLEESDNSSSPSEQSKPWWETNANEDSKEDELELTGNTNSRTKTRAPVVRKRLEPKSYAFLRMPVFRAWRRLARELGLVERFPREKIYERVWNASAREFELSFCIPQPNSTWEPRRPAFLGVPGFSSESRLVQGTLCPTFVRGCLLDPIPPYQLQVSGTQTCLFPALFLEDLDEDVEDEESVLSRISSRHVASDENEDGEDRVECVVPRRPPSIVQPGFEFESSSVFSSLRATSFPDDDDSWYHTTMPNLIE